MALSHPFEEDRGRVPFLRLASPHKQCLKLLNTSDLPRRLRQLLFPRICSVIFLHSSMPRVVRPQMPSKVDVEHCRMPCHTEILPLDEIFSISVIPCLLSTALLCHAQEARCVAESGHCSVFFFLSFHFFIFYFNPSLFSFLFRISVQLSVYNNNNNNNNNNILY